MDPDCSSPPRKAPANPIRLPSMRTIVHSIWPHIPRNTPATRRRPITPVADREEGCSSGRAVGAGTVKVEGPQGPFPMEVISLGSNDEFDWDWWGDSMSDSHLAFHRFVVTRFAADDEAMDETTEVGGSQPQRLSLTPTATPVTSANSSRYHPCKFLFTTCSHLVGDSSSMWPQIGPIHRRHRPQNSNHHNGMRKACSAQALPPEIFSIPQSPLSSAARAPP